MSWALLGMAGVLVPVAVLVWAMGRSSAQREGEVQPLHEWPRVGKEGCLTIGGVTLPPIPVHHAAGAAIFLRSVRPPFVPWSPGMKVPCRPPEMAEKPVRASELRDRMLHAQGLLRLQEQWASGYRQPHPFRSTGSDL